MANATSVLVLKVNGVKEAYADIKKLTGPLGTLNENMVNLTNAINKGLGNLDKLGVKMTDQTNALSGFTKELNNFINALGKIKLPAGEVGVHFDDLNVKITKFLGLIGADAFLRLGKAVVGAFHKMSAAAVDFSRKMIGCVTASEEFIGSQRRLGQAIANKPEITQDMKYWQKYASELTYATTMEEKAINKILAQAIDIGKSDEEVRDITETVLNYAAAGGNAADALKAIGSATNGNIDSLRRHGTYLTDQEKKLIKFSNNSKVRVKVAIKALRRQYKDFARLSAVSVTAQLQLMESLTQRVQGEFGNLFGGAVFASLKEFNMALKGTKEELEDLGNVGFGEKFSLQIVDLIHWVEVQWNKVVSWFSGNIANNLNTWGKTILARIGKILNLVGNMVQVWWKRLNAAILDRLGKDIERAKPLTRNIAGILDMLGFKDAADTVASWGNALGEVATNVRSLADDWTKQVRRAMVQTKADYKGTSEFIRQLDEQMAKEHYANTKLIEQDDKRRAYNTAERYVRMVQAVKDYYKTQRILGQQGAGGNGWDGSGLDVHKHKQEVAKLEQQYKKVGGTLMKGMVTFLDNKTLQEIRVKLENQFLAASGTAKDKLQAQLDRVNEMIQQAQKEQGWFIVQNMDTVWKLQVEQLTNAEQEYWNTNLDLFKKFSEMTYEEQQEYWNNNTKEFDKYNEMVLKKSKETADRIRRQQSFIGAAGKGAILRPDEKEAAIQLQTVTNASALTIADTETLRLFNMVSKFQDGIVDKMQSGIVRDWETMLGKLEGILDFNLDDSTHSVADATERIAQLKEILTECGISIEEMNEAGQNFGGTLKSFKFDRDTLIKSFEDFTKVVKAKRQYLDDYWKSWGEQGKAAFKEIGQSLSTMLMEFAEGTYNASESWNSLLTGLSQSIFNWSLDQVMNNIVTAASGAQASLSSIPIVGPVIGLAASTAMLATMGLWKSRLKKPTVNFAAGGYISEGLVRGGSYNRDSVAANLMPGERVLSKKEAEEYDENNTRRQTVNIVVNVSGNLATPAATAKCVRETLIPEIRKAVKQGYVLGV